MFFLLLKISNCFVLIWTVDDIINFKIDLPTTSKAIADRGKKREGKTEIQKSEYLEDKKNFLLDEIRNIFHGFRRAINEK